MEDILYDVVIIGSGPAGITAAIYAARAELSCVVIEKEPMSGGQIVNTYEVDNYPGLQGINGFDMGLKFREHADHLGAKHEYGEVVKIDDKVTHKVIYLTSGNQIITKTVILATGARYRKLTVPGEEELIGMGVSYCATCDGAFFKNRVTAVVGGGDVAVEDAIFLARLCKKVYVIHRREEFRSAKTLSTRLMSMDNVEICWNETVNKIVGEDRVTGLCLKNVKTQEEKEIAVDGVFIAVGTTPNTSMVEGLVTMDKGGYVIADETCKTSIAGIFAAGDARTKLLRQVVTAASDGANAITSVESYLNSEL
jgi:thioredoxin reductase (NADPH)